MGFVQDDDTVFDDGLIVWQSVHIQDVVVGHEDQVRLLFNLERIIVGAEVMAFSLFFDHL